MEASSTLTSFALFGTWFAAVAGTWNLFEKTGKAASEEAKRRVQALLTQQVSTVWLSRLSQSFAGAFDAIFGPKLLSFRALWRSCIASACWVAIVISLWIAIRPEGALGVWQSRSIGALIFDFVVFVATLNFIPDYLSLIKTRYLIALLWKSKSSKAIRWIIPLDAGSSAAIGIFAFFLTTPLAQYFNSDGLTLSQCFAEIAQISSHLLFLMVSLNMSEDIYYLPFGVCFYATFFTSVWLWLYCLSGALLTTGNAVEKGRKLLVKFTNVEDEPFLSLGLATIALETLLFLLLAVVLVLR
jgi:hypothetical protein